MSALQDIVIGIDLGTTNSLVAVCDDTGPRVLRDEAGQGCLPSFLTFDPNGAVTVGEQAKQHAVENPLSSIFSIKRLMGRGFDELTASGELAHLPFRVVKRASEVGSTSAQQRDVAAVEINGRLLTPPEISALVLRALRERACQQLGGDIRKAVITVPAYFDDAQRQATRDAGRIAGLEVVRIINEPTAAALAYGLGVREQDDNARGSEAGADRPATTALPLAERGGAGELSGLTGERRAHESVVAVYDLGGGTFDVSILRISGGVYEVLSTHGNSCLGGDDFDRSIIGLVQNEIETQFELSIESPATRQALRSLAEHVKMRLSSERQAALEIDLGHGRSYRRTLTRQLFESLIGPQVDTTLAACRRAVEDAGLTPEAIDRVILVGGSTRIPLVRRKVEDFFGRVPYTALNPEEVVALGAAVQAAVLAGRRRDTLLLDVIPLSLGIETLGGAMSKLILRNSRIPCQVTERFSTFVDGQTNVKINVLQGERELVRDCRSLGEFELRGIPPMPAGMPKIAVSFLVDENGILNVSAVEERSGRQASIQIVPTHGLTTEEVQRMELEAYAHAREDMTAHRLIDLRNQVAFDTHKAERMLEQVGDALGESKRAEITAAIADLRALAEKTDDADALYDALNAFDRTTLKLAEMAITATLRQGNQARES